MKKLLWMFIFMMSIGTTYSQDLLGKTKAQAKIVVSKKIAPKSFEEVGTTPILGYDKWWYSSKSDPQFFCYFNNKGICFLECMVTKDVNLAKLALAYHKTQSNFYIYSNDNPLIQKQQFVEGKTSIEVIGKNNPQLGNTFYFWFFKPEYKLEVLKFFDKYYRKD